MHTIHHAECLCIAFSFVWFGDRVSLCRPDWPGTHLVDQTDLELTKTHLPLPLRCWDWRCALSHPAHVCNLYGALIMNQALSTHEGYCYKPHATDEEHAWVSESYMVSSQTVETGPYLLYYLEGH